MPLLGVIAVAALVVIVVAWALLRRRGHRTTTDDSTDAVDAVDAPIQPEVPVAGPDTAAGRAPPAPTPEATADTAGPEGTYEDGDPIEMPPAAIRMHSPDRDPWGPARTFSDALCQGDHEPSVELPELVILRDGAREPLVIRDVPGRPDELLVTTPPDRMSAALEQLVRSLLDDGYSVDETGGRRIVLAREAEHISLTVEQPAPA